MITFKKIIQKMRQADQAVSDFFYPPRCPFCDRVILPKEGICPECRKKISEVREPSCMKCGKPMSSAREEYCTDCEKKKHIFAQGKALWVYDQTVKKSIYRFKYRERQEYGKVYAAEAAARYGSWIKSRQIEAVVPIPLHKNRKKKRGYNQSEIIAKEIGRLLGIPVLPNLLIRVKDTKPQKALNSTERKNNLKKAFKTQENIVQLKYVLMVDDIYTTGSTLDAAALALKEAGVREVYACCISTGG